MGVENEAGTTATVERGGRWNWEGEGETVLLLSWVKRIKRKLTKKKEFNLFKSQELILNAFYT